MYKILISLILVFSFVGADTLKIFSPIAVFDKFVFENPNGQKMTIPDTTRTIVVSFEKDTGKLVNGYLETKQTTYLSKHDAVFIADINNMPTIITKLFALPKLREYKHPIYLHFEEEFEKYVPVMEEQVTVIKLEDKKVQSISYISTLDELKAVFEK